MRKFGWFFLGAPAFACAHAYGSKE